MSGYQEKVNEVEEEVSELGRENMVNELWKRQRGQ